MTTYDESATGLMIPRSTNGRSPDAALAGYVAMVEILESRLGELEQQLTEQGWGRLDGSAGREFSRDALGKIVDLARVMYLKNPIINRGVEVSALYVWGQDLSVNATDENIRLVIDRFWKDNQRTLTGQQSARLLEVELQVTGNVFLALFPDRITGDVRVRGVPVEEVQQIITNPEDRAEVWYYRRTWTEQPLGGGTSTPRTAYYPDCRYQPANRPATISEFMSGEVEVRWDSPLLHVKAGAFAHWRWGVPEVYSALDWAKAYKELLEDDATRSRALARFAWSLTTKGGKDAVAAAKTKLGTTLNSGGGYGAETNPPPVPGSTFIASNGVAMDPIKIAGATLDPDHSRPVRQMASAALGIPDHFFDADVGNFATAKTLDRPTELRFSERRQMWRDVFSDLCQWVIDADLAATRGMLSKTISEDARAVELSWPDLLEPDVTARVTAVNTAAPFMPEELTARLMMTALNVENIDEELAKLAAEKEEAAKRAAEIAAQQAKASPQQPPAPNPAQQTESLAESEIELTDLADVVEWVSAHVPKELRSLINATLMKPEPSDG